MLFRALFVANFNGPKAILVVLLLAFLSVQGCFHSSVESRPVVSDIVISIGVRVIKIQWQTDVPTSGQAMLCSGENCLWSGIDDLDTNHEAEISTEPGKQYKVTIVAIDKNGKETTNEYAFSVGSCVIGE